jgi:mRNA-degrading endonuclease RelE of RelBE toxin-antitoxin system
MSYNVTAIPNFRRELKKLAKKFSSLKDDFVKLIASLQIEPFQGKSLGNNCYKIRMAIASKGKGKSGGSRIITYLQISQTTVYLLSIYDKSNKENIPDKELKELLKFIPE